jgi:Tat protein secretion system quality control protein TatD with DNase activity
MKIGNNPSTPFDVKEVYSFVSAIKAIEAKELENIVFSNVHRVFPGIT